MARVLSSKLMLWLGNRSFSIYVWHFAVQIMIELINICTGRRIDYSKPIIWVSYIVITIVFTWTYDIYIKKHVDRIEIIR